MSAAIPVADSDGRTAVLAAVGAYDRILTSEAEAKRDVRDHEAECAHAANIRARRDAALADSAAGNTPRGDVPSRAEYEAAEESELAHRSAANRAKAVSLNLTRAAAARKDEAVRAAASYVRSDIRPEALRNWHAALDALAEAGAIVMGIDHILDITLRDPARGTPVLTSLNSFFGPVAELLEGFAGLNWSDGHGDLRPGWLPRHGGRFRPSELPGVAATKTAIRADLELEKLR